MPDLRKKNISFSITEKLLYNFLNFPAFPAFYIQEVSYTYLQLKQRIAVIQKYILSEIPDNEIYIGILSHDHIDSYASIFAIWFSGKAFVPLNPLNPSERNREIISQVELKHILCAGHPLGLSSEFHEIVINTKSLGESDHRIITRMVSPESDAYVLFTSGSTGKPKGVPISRRNLDSFYHSYIEFGPGYTNSDRFLQMYDISFDGSIPCYLVALLSGACVYTVPQDEIKYLYALKLMSEHALTVVKMTPSTLYYLKPFFDRIQLPKVRVCIFGGEALPYNITREWMKCVPNSLIQNVYGPTEATIDSLMYNFNSGDFQNKESDGVISLGKSLGDFVYAVLDQNGSVVDDGTEGELCLHGSQLMNAYWRDDEMTTRAFIFIETEAGTKKFYRTGDLVSRDKDGFFMYRGRIDNQVQIQGYRVELSEIEHHARDFVGEVNLAAVVSHSSTGNQEIVLFLSGEEKAADGLLLYLQTRIPYYMLPSRIIYMKELPRQVSGKTDRKLLSQKADLYDVD